MRTVAVAEDILLGSGIFLKSPFSENPLETAKTSWKILKEVPLDALSAAALPLRYIFWDLVLAFGEPKLLIVDGVEYAELYREHLANNTLGTQAYYRDLSYVQGRANTGLLIWQGVSYVVREDTDRTENGYYSRWIIKNLNRRDELRQIN